MAVAAFLASIGTSIGAFAIDNSTVAIAGAICAALSAAIYAAAEAYVDGKRCESNATSTVTTTPRASDFSSNVKS